MKKKAISTVTPGLYAVGDRVRPIHEGEYYEFGSGLIVSIDANRKRGNPYEIKFASAEIPLFYRENEIQK